jgi:hypothetical protein
MIRPILLREEVRRVKRDAERRCRRFSPDPKNLKGYRFGPFHSAFFLVSFKRTLKQLTGRVSLVEARPRVSRAATMPSDPDPWAFPESCENSPMPASPPIPSERENAANAMRARCARARVETVDGELTESSR